MRWNTVYAKTLRNVLATVNRLNLIVQSVIKTFSQDIFEKAFNQLVGMFLIAVLCRLVGTDAPASSRRVSDQNVSHQKGARRELWLDGLGSWRAEFSKALR